MEVEGCSTRAEWLAMRTAYYRVINPLDYKAHQKARADWMLDSLPSCETPPPPQVLKKISNNRRRRHHRQKEQTAVPLVSYLNSIDDDDVV